MKNLRNTKKVILLALCAVMLLSLCACGRSREESRYYPEPAAAPAIFTDSSSLAGGTNGFAMMAMNDSAVSEEYAYEADSFSAKEAPAAVKTHRVTSTRKKSFILPMSRSRLRILNPPRRRLWLSLTEAADGWNPAA